MKTYRTGGGWGDSITWDGLDQFQRPTGGYKVVGWKQDIPQAGDLLESQFKKGLARFQFVEVEPSENGPSDMFFATVSFMGYVHQETVERKGWEMTFETAVTRILLVSGLSLQEAKVVLEEIKANPDNDPMAGRWMHNVEDYPESVLTELCRASLANWAALGQLKGRVGK